MKLNFLFILLVLTSCTQPVYQNTTYDIEEFIADSQQIARGKQAILEMEGLEITPCSLNTKNLFEEVIIEGDQLVITLYCPKRIDRMKSLAWISDLTGFQVCKGSIYLPDLAFIEVEGLTLKEVQEKIQQTYCNQLPDAQVFVNFKKRRERQVQIIGAHHCMISLQGKMHLSEVLAKAQIPPDANLFKSYVMRENQSLPLDLYKLIHEGDESQNIVMRGGDQVYIAKASDASVMITGEVPQPLVVPVPYGSISLRQALVMAGGIPFTGDKRCIQVIRGHLKRPKIYCLSWQEITHLPNPSLLLMPGDVVVISEEPITQWNRFINQLQPSTASMQNTYNIYRLIQLSTQ